MSNDMMVRAKCKRFCPTSRYPAMIGSLVSERCVVEIDGGKLVLLGPVVLGVLPFGLVAALWQEVHAAHHIAGVEVLGIDPRQQGHIRVLSAERRCDLPHAFVLHMVEQSAHEVGHQIRPGSSWRGNT